MRALAVLFAVLAASGPQLVQRSEQTLPLLFNQGIARVEGGWILSGTNSPMPGTDVIERVDDQLTPVAVQPLAIPTDLRAAGYSHIGDIDVVGNIIYAPFEQPDYELNRQATARYDATTLAFIDAVELAQHENSFVTVDEATMIAYSMDRFDGSTLQRYKVTDRWAPLPPLPLSMTLVHTQGADIADGAIWISTSDDHNGVYRVDLASGATTSVGTLGHIGAEGEGIDATALPSGAFHALVNDPFGGVVHLGHYDLTTDGGQPPSSSSVSASPLLDTSAASALAASGGETRWPVGAAISGAAAVAWRLRRTRQQPG